MRERLFKIRKAIAAGITVSMCMVLGTGAFSVQAEELIGIFEESTDAFPEESASEDTVLMAESAPLTGTWTAPEGWVEDTDAGTEETRVYKQDGYLEVDATSTITCSYIDTNYSVLEYEQLREMLTNNLVYANVDAMISTSATYTLNKDYLYILIVDDSAKEYRTIYYYVVGDYRCFCAEVKEYRTEAEQLKALEQKTPQEIGQKVAEEFTWSTSW